MPNESLQKQSLNQMVSRVLNEQQEWSKHLSKNCCKCEKCTCGHHLCKYEPLKMNLKYGQSQYKQQYVEKGNSLDHKNKINLLSSEQYHPKQFVQKSQYKQEYVRKKGKSQVKRAGPRQGNMELGGPTFFNTTYQAQYVPRTIEIVTQIKNPQNLGGVPSKLTASTNYKDNYGRNRPDSRRAPIRPIDNIGRSSSVSFIGKSSYNNDYHKMVPISSQNQSFAPHQTYRPTHGVRPKSSYRVDFTEKRKEPCPALLCKDC